MPLAPSPTDEQINQLAHELHETLAARDTELRAMMVDADAAVLAAEQTQAAAGPPPNPPGGGPDDPPNPLAEAVATAKAAAREVRDEINRVGYPLGKAEEIVEALQKPGLK